MMQRFADWAIAPRSPVNRWGFAAFVVAVSVLARIALADWLSTGFPYVTFFPAVILAAFFSGVFAGSIVALVCGLIAWFAYIAPAGSFALDGSGAIALGLYVFVVTTDLFLVHIMTLALRRASRAEARSQELAQSRELMFKELQHRVSNNLAVVASLLSLQRRKLVDDGARRSLEEAAARVALVARLQRMLHDPGRQEIDFGGFLRAMAADAVAAADLHGRVEVEVLAQSVIVTPDQSVPLALVATELLSNAVEHGHAGRRSGTVRVRLANLPDDRAEVVIADGGGGLPDGFDLATTDSLGLTVARQFAEQLGAVLTIDGSASGVVSRLVFPLDRNAAEAAPRADAQTLRQSGPVLAPIEE